MQQKNAIYESAKSWTAFVALIFLAVLFICLSPSKPSEKNSQGSKEESAAKYTGSSFSEDGDLAASVNSSNLVDMKRKRSLYLIARELDKYYQKNSDYPVSISPMNADDENSPLRSLIPEYFLKNDSDGLGKGQHFIYRSDGKSYELSAILENKDDKWCVAEGENCVYRIKDGAVASQK